ncbi:MAG: UvrD-helicase domain-containing protein, partial [Cytophagales bacterium]|nr:UvrD-helicase domain-containing protein [Cytophagales bacterium]
MEKPFHIYRSSAGSGKTRVLAREYIRLALRRPDYFRYILAMTFTNKSTQEMKDRILQYLSAFANGESQDLATEIIDEQRKEGVLLTPVDLRKKSKETLDFLLHHYAEFSVSTIDAFFQRIIRSFTRETGLLGNFRLEVDNAAVQEEVIALLMAQLSDNVELRGWVIDFSMDKLVDGKDWDV